MCPLRVLVIGAMLATVAPQAAGQSPALQPGDWVRYRIRPCSAASSLPAFCGTRDEASVTSVRPDSIHVTSRTEGTPVSIALHDMAHVERYAGRKSAFWRGAGIGAAIGAVGGIVVGSVVLEPSSCDGWGFSFCIGNRSTLVQTTTLAGVLGGGLLGGVLGAVLRKDHWQSVSFDAPRLSIRPLPRGLLLVVGLAPLDR